jgi:hypothetical protein
VLGDFDPARAASALRELGMATPMIHTAARKEISIDAWLDWLESQLKNPLQRRRGAAQRPAMQEADQPCA